MTEEGSSVANMMCLMTSRIETIAKGIDKEQIASFVHAILNANRIYVISIDGMFPSAFVYVHLLRLHFFQKFSVPFHEDIGVSVSLMITDGSIGFVS